MGSNDRFNNVYKVLNLKFQRVPLNFGHNILPTHWKLNCIQSWILITISLITPTALVLPRQDNDYVASVGKDLDYFIILVLTNYRKWK